MFNQQHHQTMNIRINPFDGINLEVETKELNLNICLSKGSGLEAETAMKFVQTAYHAVSFVDDQEMDTMFLINELISRLPQDKKELFKSLNP
jgi:hypothetical protein